MRKTWPVESESQLPIKYQAVEDGIGTGNLSEAFRRLYYHLYTNSKASRAERIIEDLSLLLLLKLAVEANGGAQTISRYRNGSGRANELLIPLLRRTYPGLVDANQRFSIGDEALRNALRDLDAINLSTAPAHVLGEAFQALMGPRLRGDKGQFFTPRSLVKAMVEIVAPQPKESMLDPACGTGGFLMETHAYQMRYGKPEGRLVGIDKDHDLFRLSSALLQLTTRGRGKVLNCNSLDLGQWGEISGEGNDSLFDVILTNPPFGARIGLSDTRLLQDFALGHQWVLKEGMTEWNQTGALLSTQDPQILFLELCVRKLKLGGRLGIVLPEGIFGNKGDAYIWDWLRGQGKVFALLDCPRTTFQPGTDTKTNVLFFEKGTPGKARLPHVKDSVRIAVALHCGHDRRGRTNLSNGTPHPDDFSEAAKAFNDSKSGDTYWRTVKLRVGDYMVPRYYAEEKPVTVQEAELTCQAKTATLGELVATNVLAISKGHEVGSDAYGTGEVPFVRTSDISNFEISTDPTKSVAQEIYEQFAAQQVLKPGDVLIVVDGRYRIGSTAMLTETNYRCVVQSHLKIISVLRPDVLDPFELLFALNLPSVRLRIRDLVFVQSTLGTLGKRLWELRIPILHGDGPWRERIDRFRNVLRERDRQLSDLKAISGTDYEL